MSKKMRQLVATLVTSTMVVGVTPVDIVAGDGGALISGEVVINTSHYSGVSFNSMSPNIAYRLHDKEDYKDTSSWISIPEGTWFRIVGNGESAESFRVKFEAARSYHIKLDHVVIDLRDEEGVDAPIVVGANKASSHVTIQLIGENKIYASDTNAGIELQSSTAKLIIEDDLTNDQVGSLEVTGGSYAAAIGQGGSNYIHIGDIIIKSGEVIAHGGSHAAAIGTHTVGINKIEITGGNILAIAHADNGIPIGTMETSNFKTKEMTFTGGKFVGIDSSGNLVNVEIPDGVPMTKEDELVRPTQTLESKEYWTIEHVASIGAKLSEEALQIVSELGTVPVARGILA